MAKISFKILTLTPEIHSSFFLDGVLKRAISEGNLSVEVISLRDYSQRADKRVDDKPFGGGPGMVIRADVTARAIEANRSSDSWVIFLTPSGRVFDNNVAHTLSMKKEIIFVCGRYEGFDSRVVEKYADQEISLGDFVLSGGDVAALAILDAVSRFVPGVLGNPVSATLDSFEDGLLEAPVYTQPQEFGGSSVPSVYLSGDHQKIEKFRRSEKVRTTALRRPDLILEHWEKLSESEKKLATKTFRRGT